ncbi:MAG: alpha/beta hydrolase [Sulfitobacter sp.]
MSKLRFHGPLKHRLASFLTLNRALLSTYISRAFGRKIEPSWDAHSEIGIRFWRRQFTKAMAQSDMKLGRAIFDSLQTETDDVYDVRVERCDSIDGQWFYPRRAASDTVLLYLHGGGYTFNGPISTRFASMLAHYSQVRLFMPKYRLTPEHPHPAQAEDALAAWQFLTQTHSPDRIVVIGDSAGGHMALMLLQTLREKGLRQPALCIGLCPWTDIGARGDSLFENDKYDLVQGWMALRFGEWLDPDGKFGRTMLSPISYDFAGLAPLYLQSGGREILHDMICDFADVQAAKGADLMLDVWPDMPHNFHAYDSMKSSSTQALSRIREAVQASTGNAGVLAAAKATTFVSGKFGQSKAALKDR